MHKVDLTGLAVAGFLAFAGAAHGQPFADAKVSRAGYSGGNLEPAQPCERLAELKLPELKQIAARAVAADGATPAHCRGSSIRPSFKPSTASHFAITCEATSAIFSAETGASLSAR